MSQTKTVSGIVTTYVITDLRGNTVTVAVTDGPGSGRQTTFTSSGGLQPDGQLQLTTLMELVSTGLLP